MTAAKGQSSTPSLCSMKEICKRAWWVKFSKAVKSIWKVMKFRLLHCLWAHHPEMEPDYWTNTICIEESTWRPVFQRRLESCSCQGDSYGQIFKEPRHPVYWELLKDTDHLFFMPKWTSFKKSSVTGVFWAPVKSHKRWSGDGSQRMLLWPPADPEAGQGWHSHCLRGWEHAGCPKVGSPCAVFHSKHLWHPGDRGAMEIIPWRTWLFAKGITFVILPQYDFSL